MENLTIVKPANVSWEEYRDLRLLALKEDPQAFASSYEKEKHTTDEEWQQRLERYCKGDGNWMVFASNGKQLVGMVGAYQSDEDKKQYVANMIAMFVKKEERKKGIGKLLMTSLLSELKNASIITVKLSVNIQQQTAVRLYESLGFTITGKESFEFENGSYQDIHHMEKQI